MRRGSVIVDLAAENGGNVEGCVRDQATVTDNGVTILGYSDLVSRLPTTASNLFGNNVARFLLSVGPQTQGTKGVYEVDYDDEAVRGMLAVDRGTLTYPAPRRRRRRRCGASTPATPSASRCARRCCCWQASPPTPS